MLLVLEARPKYVHHTFHLSKPSTCEETFEPWASGITSTCSGTWGGVVLRWFLLSWKEEKTPERYRPTRAMVLPFLVEIDSVL